MASRSLRSRWRICEGLGLISSSWPTSVERSANAVDELFIVAQECPDDLGRCRQGFSPDHPDPLLSHVSFHVLVGGAAQEALYKLDPRGQTGLHGGARADHQGEWPIVRRHGVEGTENGLVSEIAGRRPGSRFFVRLTNELACPIEQDSQLAFTHSAHL
jgi:hypothetical protein